MSINNHNAGTDLNDVNLGALAISDDNDKNNNNDDDDDEGGNDINAAELLSVPNDHPMVSVFSQMGLKKEVVLFGGIQVAGKIRCTNSRLWKMFGGNANWPEIVAVYSPHLVKPLDLESKDDTTSLSLLRNLLAVDSRPAIRHQSVHWNVLTDGSIRPRLDLAQFVFEVKMTLGTKPFALAFDSADFVFNEDEVLSGRGIRFPLSLVDAKGIRSEHNKAATDLGKTRGKVLIVDKIDGSTTIINKRTMRTICINRVQTLSSFPGWLIEEGTSVQPGSETYVLGTVTRTNPTTGEPFSGLDPLPIKSQFVIHTPSQLSAENTGFIDILFLPIENISIVFDHLNWD